MLDPARLERIGVYQDPVDRQYKRDRIRNADFEYDRNDPEAERKGLLVAYEQRLVPHPVILPLSTDPASIEEARLKAVASGADFYHPDHGWLRWGRKRETERPENLGAGTVRYKSRRVTLAPSEAPFGGGNIGGAPIIPDPEPEPEPTPEPEPEPASPLGRKGSTS